MRTVPVPTWVKAAVDRWLTVAGVTTGPIFRAINKARRIGNSGFSPKVICGVVKAGCAKWQAVKCQPNRSSSSISVPTYQGRWSVVSFFLAKNLRVSQVLPNPSISQGLNWDTGQYGASEGPWNGRRAKWVEGSRGVFIAPGGCGRASRMVE